MASQLTVMRSRVRASSRASSGPKASANKKRGDHVGQVERQRRAGDREEAAGVWLAPIVHV